MATYYEHDHGAFGREVLCAGFMLANMGARASRVKAVAEAISPEYTGEYKGSFGTYVHVGHSGGPEQRAIGTVYNSSDHAHIVEFGGGPTPRYRILGRALGAAGGEINYLHGAR